LLGARFDSERIQFFRRLFDRRPFKNWFFMGVYRFCEISNKDYDFLSELKRVDGAKTGANLLRAGGDNGTGRIWALPRADYAQLCSPSHQSSEVGLSCDPWWGVWGFQDLNEHNGFGGVEPLGLSEGLGPGLKWKRGKNYSYGKWSSHAGT
jgi:hypothetical protein